MGCQKPPPFSLGFGESPSELVLLHAGTTVWEVATRWREAPLHWLQTERDEGWTWSKGYCPHERDRDATPTEPGERWIATEVDDGVPRGRHRWVAWVREPGGEWQMVTSEPFEVGGFGDGDYAPWEGWMPEWDEGVRITIGEIRKPPPWKEDPDPDLFDFDVQIENRLGQEIEYNPSSNYWLCEGVGGWARHPGSTICGNQASWPRIPPGETGSHGWYGRGFGRFRFGMTFQKPHRDGLLAAALSEPFSVVPKDSADR